MEQTRRGNYIAFSFHFFPTKFGTKQFFARQPEKADAALWTCFGAARGLWQAYSSVRGLLQVAFSQGLSLLLANKPSTKMLQISHRKTDSESQKGKKAGDKRKI